MTQRVVNRLQPRPREPAEGGARLDEHHVPHARRQRRIGRDLECRVEAAHTKSAPRAHNVGPITGRARRAASRSTDRNDTAGTGRCIGGLCSSPSAAGTDSLVKLGGVTQGRSIDARRLDRAEPFRLRCERMNFIGTPLVDLD
jgi:hypothetical protein